MFDWHRAYFQGENTNHLRHTYATMAVMAAYADNDKLTCFPSQRTLARKLGYKNPDTVRKHVRENVKSGWLEIVEPGNSYKRPNLYRFTVPTPISGDGSTPIAADGSVTDSHLEGGATPISGDGSLGNSHPDKWVTPISGDGSTPIAKDALTTHTTTQGTTHKSSSLVGDGENRLPSKTMGVGSDEVNAERQVCYTDPFAGSGLVDLTSPSTPQQLSATPISKDGSSPIPDEGSRDDSDPKGDADVTLPDRAGLRDTGPQPGEAGFDPFANWQPAV